MYTYTCENCGNDVRRIGTDPPTDCARCGHRPWEVRIEVREVMPTPLEEFGGTATNPQGAVVAERIEKTDGFTRAWSWPAERMPASQMIGLVETCAMKQSWGILTFHGISEGRLSVADGDFRDLVTFLQGNHQRIWTAPVAKVAQRILDWRSENGI